MFTCNKIPITNVNIRIPKSGVWFGSFSSSNLKIDVGTQVIVEDLEKSISFIGEIKNALKTINDNQYIFVPVNTLDRTIQSVGFFNSPVSIIFSAILAGEKFIAPIDSRISNYVSLSSTVLQNLNNLCATFGYDFHIKENGYIAFQDILQSTTDFNSLYGKATNVTLYSFTLPLQKIELAKDINAICYTEKEVKIWI